MDRVKRSLFLLDSYHSALAVIAYEEGLIPRQQLIYGGCYEEGNNPAIKAMVLQMAVLYDDLCVEQLDGQRIFDRHQTLYIPDWTRLIDMEIVRFASLSSMAQKRINEGRNSYSSEDYFALPVADTLWPYLYRSAIDLGWDESVFNVWRAIKTRNPLLFEDAIVKVPAVQHEFLRDMAELNKLIPGGKKFDATDHALILLELKSHAYISMLDLIETEYERSGSDVAHDLLLPFKLADSALAGSQLFQVVLSELARQDLVLPMPRDLTEVRQLRANSDIQEFRRIFYPWLDAISKCDPELEQRLRKEVCACIRAFKHWAHVKTISDVVAYGSIPMGFTVAGVWGGAAGAFSTLVGSGLNRISDRWRDRGKWLNIAHKPFSR